MTDLELQQRLDAVTAKYTQEKAIETQLELPSWARLSLCQHNPGEATAFWTASVCQAGNWQGLSSDQLQAVRAAHRPGMLLAPLITYGGFVPSWAPESVNCSAGKADSKQTGEAMVALRQSGNQHYTARELRYWLQLPDVGYVELHLELACLPLGWDVEARYLSFDRQDGSPREFSIAAPSAGPPGKLRRNIGARGSWDYEAYWEDADTFRADWERATRHTTPRV